MQCGIPACVSPSSVGVPLPAVAWFLLTTLDGRLLVPFAHHDARRSGHRTAQKDCASQVQARGPRSVGQDRQGRLRRRLAGASLLAVFTPLLPRELCDRLYA